MTMERPQREEHGTQQTGFIKSNNGQLSRPDSNLVLLLQASHKGKETANKQEEKFLKHNHFFENKKSMK